MPHTRNYIFIKDSIESHKIAGRESLKRFDMVSYNTIY